MSSSISPLTRSDVRHARNSDAGVVVELLRQSHAAARWKFPFDPMRAHSLFCAHEQSAHTAAIVMEYRGSPAGILMAHAFDHPFGAGMCSFETVWFIAEEARGRGALKMLDAYEDWARDIGCVYACMASLAINDVSRIYTRCGYAPVETHFMKALTV
ncbi:GNAT family N-acetyltransferase [Agrobacterium larrymoorei]|uniref:GNAT family N-acetyltransferase n=1 Tax=Agrobacterium larrymoorei TaxID=160699 RepID=UPI0030BCF513